MLFAFDSALLFGQNVKINASSINFNELIAMELSIANKSVLSNETFSQRKREFKSIISFQLIAKLYRKNKETNKKQQQFRAGNSET